MSDADKASLLAEIAASRQRLTAAGEALRISTEGLRRKMDIPERLAGSYRKHRAVWLGGATVLGFLLSRLPARKQTVYVDEATGKRLGKAGKLGTLLALAKFSAALAKPWIGNLVGEKFTDLAQRYVSRNKSDMPPNADDPH